MAGASPEEQVRQVASGLGRLVEGDHHVREGRCEQKEGEDVEEEEGAALGDGVGLAGRASNEREPGCTSVASKE